MLVDKDIDVNGSSLQGFVFTDYQHLIDKLGEPVISDGDKTDAEWVIKFDDGTVGRQ